MKREASDSPAPSVPSTPIKKSNKTSANASPSSSNTSPQAATVGWTPEKRKLLISKLLAAGMKSYKPADLAAEVGVTQQQYKDATQSGKPNLRQKVIDAAGPMGR